MEEIVVPEGKFFAVNARVSRTDAQKVQDQETALNEYVHQHGITKEQVRAYMDMHLAETLTKCDKNRLKEDVLSGLISHILIWRFDRLFSSMSDLVDWFEFCKQHDVAIVSLKETVDTSSFAGKMIYPVLVALSEFDRDILVERTRAGLEKAKLNGKKIGRPKGGKDKKKRDTRGYLKRWNSKKPQAYEPPII
jgi:putative DNA-invertase from lambdoid prophage Rac